MNTLRSLLLAMALLLGGRTCSLADGDLARSEFSRFAVLAKVVARRQVTARPDPQLSEAMDILARAAVVILSRNPASTDDELGRRLEPLRRLLNPAHVSLLPHDAGWFAVGTSRRGSLRAIGVTLGSASRLYLFDTAHAKTIVVPAAMAWKVRWRQRPKFVQNGALLVISDEVRDTGIRAGVLIELLQPGAAGYSLRKSIRREVVLDKASAVSVAPGGDSLTITSIDAPKALRPVESDTHFGRDERYVIDASGLRLVHSEARDPELRAIDEWIFAAGRAKRPTSSQAMVCRTVRDGGPFSTCRVVEGGGGWLQVIIGFDRSMLRFVVVRPSANHYRVATVQIGAPTTIH